ncbi:DUF1129 family protein [Vagococcus luciliae]|uniref:DUF1129 domain-containing protein n=1 Tax=Vagococcus luciliae TaxID=2920380 RepID=A0ABY5NZS3_9ENTE|nr:DUF1129 family protein [Vagococcus luciliae]UUV98983.1 hypothetical protein G314FT_11410 [Vagococcus luciliae]
MIEKMIEKNNELRDKLTPENKKYYEKILLYTRFKGLFGDDELIETVLLNMLYDLIDAQESGISAEDYFGRKPKQYLDELFKEMPQVPLSKKLSIFYMVFGISSGFSLFSTLTQKNPSINILTIILNGLLSILLVFSVFKYLEKMTFKVSKQSKILEYIGTFVIGGLLTVGFIGSVMIGNKFLSLPVPLYVSMVVIVLIMIVVSYYIIKRKNKPYYSYLIFGWGITFFTTVSRLPQTQKWFESEPVMIGSIIVILLSSFLTARFSQKAILNEDK